MKTFYFPGSQLFKINCLFLILLTASCANPYRKNYLSTIQKWPSGVSNRVLPPSGPPQLVSSTDMKKDAQTMLESGYVLLGRSVFRNSQLDEAMAIQQGEEIGAWVVMVKHNYVSTVTESVPMGTWTPDQTTVTQTTTQIQRDPRKAPVEVQQQTVQTVQGQFGITYVPQNVDYFDYSASFWAKTKPSPIGVLVQPLSDDLKSRYQTNKGVVVRAVVVDSPAYEADILRGDVLTELAGEIVRTPDNFFDIVWRNEGKKVTLNLIRDGQPLTVQLQLNK